MQIGTADVADEERVAGEDHPRLGVAAATVSDDVGVVRRCMSRGLECPNACVPEDDLHAVLELLAAELDYRPRWQVRRRPGRFDECGKSRDVIGLDVCLEDRYDGRTRARRLLQVPVDELLMRIDHGEFPLR